jgi:hypothetical protein
MAENTTTYNVVVDTEVKGQDQLEGVGDAAETTGGKFTRLQRQIRDTQVALQQAAESGDTVKFNKLKADLDELQDKLELTQLSSQQFDDALAGLPGPAGQAGQAIKSLDGLFKAFLANPILVTIAAIVGVFVSLKEALSRTEEGQAKLNKISEGFTKILNGLFAILEPIANLFADLIIGLMENEAVMNGLAKTAGVLSAAFTVVFNVGKQLVGFIVNNMVNAFKTLVDVAGGAGKVLKGVFTFDLDLIKEGVSQVSDGIKKGFNATVDNVKNTVKGIGEGVVDGIKDGFKQGEEQFKKGQARLTDAQKKAQEERNKKAQEANKKLTEEEKKLQDQRVKDVEAGNKVVTEAYLAGLEARDREIYKRGQVLNENLVTLEKKREAQIADVLKKAGVNISKVVDETGKIKFDLPDVKAALQKNASEVAQIDDEFKSGRLIAQEAYNKDVAAINTKFDEEEAKKKEEKKQKEREAAKAAFDEAVMANENKVQSIEQSYNKEIALVNENEKLKIEAIKLATSEALKNIYLTEEERKAAIANGLNEAQALEQKREQIIKDGSAKIQQIESDAATTRLALQQGRYDELIAAVNEREQILLSNTELTEAQKTKILLDAEAERAAIEQTRRDDAVLGIENELNNITTSYDRRRELIGQKEAELLAQEGLTENQRTQIRQQAADERKAIDMAELEARAELQTAYLDLAQNFGSFLQQIAGKNKKLAIAGVIVEQAAAIGKIVVNTGIANAKALAASPLTFGMPWVAINTATAALSIASSIAGAVKAIQQINNSDSGAPATGGGANLPKSAGGRGMASTAPTAPTAAGTIPVPQIVGTQTQATPGAQIAQTLGAASGKPIKAYVVSGDVTSQQALDRRTTRAATFSGGTNG